MLVVRCGWVDVGGLLLVYWFWWVDNGGLILVGCCGCVEVC